MNTTLKLLASAAILSASTASMAAITGKVDVKLNVSTGCIVEGSEDNGAMNNFGELDFGRTASGWTNILTSELVAPGTGGKIEVKCDGTDPVEFKVSVNGGDRTLKAGAAADTVKYTVYRDSARSNEYKINTEQKFTAEPGASTQVPMFGSIVAGQGDKAQGEYTDTLLVNITF